MKINNLPSYATDYPFIVASIIDDELWFYGAYRDSSKAEQVALSIDGIAINSDQITT